MSAFIKTVAMFVPEFAPTVQAGLDPYIQGDAIPVPDVLEKNSESVWALWTDVVQEHNVGSTGAQSATQFMGLDELPNEPQPDLS